MPSQNCKRSVDLFSQDRSRKLVRHRHRRERNQHISLLPPLFRMPVVPANCEYQIMAQHFSLTENLSKRIRIQRHARRIHQNFLRRWVFRPKVKPVQTDLRHGAGRVVRSSFHVLGRHCVRMGVFRFTDKIDEDLQSLRLGNSFSGRDRNLLRFLPQTCQRVELAGRLGEAVQQNI